MSSQDKPSTVYPSSPTSVNSPMPIYIPDPSLKGVSFDQLLQNRGIRFIHRKATLCPNMSLLDDSNHLPNCPFCDNSGILYYDEREIWGIFQSNSVEKTFETHGIWEIGNAVVTLPTEYSTGEQADFNTYDELIIPDFQVRLWELKEYTQTPTNTQSLRYPVKKVDYLAVVNQDDNTLQTFTQDTDFIVTTDGDIEWLPGHTPKYDSSRNRGQVYTVVYWANPIYKVLQPLRELRVSQEMVNGQKISRRLPQQILVKRDFLVSNPEKLPAGQTF